ncbi:MBL fold metallo-hydrolase [Pararhizobium haloflavum]|uniref:MBL fold metallo-hydrolase n=1 Tax=Pararhizobium haloflavum TaxID=2037914 RepID=UPI0018E415F0|nr:MBL fold metallo-hydrolase [Pararhizobium haloflavum]
MRNQTASRTIRLTRRRFVQLSALTTLAAALPGFAAIRARAQDMSLALGENTLTTVSDGNLMLPLDFAFPDVDQQELIALLEASGLSADGLEPDCNVSVLRTPNGLVVFDLGAGANFMPSAGEFLQNFEAAGFSIDEVTDVVFTHAHPDHLWGLLDDFDELMFPDAAYHMAEAEHAYWTAPDTLEKTPEAAQSFVVGAQSRLDVLADRINLFKPGAEVLSGVEAMDTGGHTPGHTSFVIHGGDEPVMIVGDALNNHVVSFQRPDWRSGTDQNPDRAIETRKMLLDRLAAENMRIVGFHMPEPGNGRVERDGEAYRFVAGE